MTETLQRTEYFYASSNALQNVAVWQFPPDQILPPLPGTKKYWLIFLHGGAWCDPRTTFDEAEPTLAALLAPPPAAVSAAAAAAAAAARLPHACARIAGIASLNYRLSPHAAYAQAPAHTPAFGARAARHPAHLADVLAGLRFLQARLGVGGGYVLAGHSAGASLAFQLLLVLLGGGGGGGDATCLLRGGDGDGRFAAADDNVIVVAPPAAVVGLAGIYDLAGLNRRKGGAYAGFMEAAFGRDEEGRWDAASPATAGGSFGGWGADAGRLAVVAHSPDDELVDMAECDAMEARLRKDGVGNVRVYRDLEGGHNEMLKNGSSARVIRETWLELEKLDKA